ncbi:MAG: RNA polymerase subunit sigma-24 [Planctomycetaceae bacterium]|nr:RNA polymerase subunit sigma-24 [Planctomycetaceae bacterium]
MVDRSQHSTANVTQHLLAKANNGAEASREQLLQHCCDRLERLSRKMLRSFPSVQRWEQTDDVFQNASMRLMRSLEDVKPESVRHFFALAATRIRRELIDLARHYSRANGATVSIAGHHSANSNGNGKQRNSTEPAKLTNAPDQLACWTELHTQIANLPDEEREVCELLWYQGLTQPEAAELLDMPLRALKRRWQKIRITLHDAMNGQFP